MNADQKMQLTNIAAGQLHRNGPGVDTNALFATTILLEYAELIETHSLNLLGINELGVDGGPDPLRDMLATATATTTPFASTQGIAEANAAIANEGTLDIRATEPRTYGDVLPGLMRWLKEHYPDKAEELERDGDLKPTGQSEPRTRVRVRDELHEIVSQIGNPGLNTSKLLVDRILDRLHGAAWPGDAAAFIYDVREGEL